MRKIKIIQRGLFHTKEKTSSVHIERIDELRRFLKYHSHRYYVSCDPEITDETYDKMFRELEDLEKKFPELITPDSPTQVVGH